MPKKSPIRGKFRGWREPTPAARVGEDLGERDRRTIRGRGGSRWAGILNALGSDEPGELAAGRVFRRLMIASPARMDLLAHLLRRGQRGRSGGWNQGWS